MANITRTAALVKPTKPLDSEIHDMRCAVAVDHQVVYQVTATGRANLASAAAATVVAKPLGVALGNKGIGDSNSILKRGFCAGFDVSAMAWNAQIFLSDTPGELADAAGTVSVVVGKVMAVPDDPAGMTKLAYLDFSAFWLS